VKIVSRLNSIPSVVESVAVSQALVRLARLSESTLDAQEAQRLGEALQAARAVAATIGRSSEVRQT